jgi:hypothetical protein
VTDLLLDAIRSAVRAELDAALAAHLEPVLAALKAATPPAQGLSVEKWSLKHDVSSWTTRRRIADGSLPHTRIGRRIVIAADATPGTAGDDRIAVLAARARAGR